MTTNNSINQASEILVIGPIGTAADSSSLLTISKNQAATTQVSLFNGTNSANASTFYKLGLTMNASATIATGGIGFLSDLYAADPSLAGFLLIQNNLTSNAEPGKGVYIRGTNATDVINVGIGNPVVSQANWSSSGGQYRGFNGNTAPVAGFIGELISNTATTGTLTNSTITNVTSISLTAGIWDVCGVCFYATAGTVAGNTEWRATIATANNTLTGTGENGAAVDGGKIPVNGVNNVTCWVGPTRVSLAATTTIYLNCRGSASITFTSVTCTGIIRAVRVA